MCYFYILYSRKSDLYYYGSTHNLKIRLQKHKTNHKGWTGRDKEWQIVYYEKYASLTEALKREKQVKSWKNRKRTETLIGNSTDYRVPT